MKKLTVLALMATVLVASPMLARSQHLVVAPNATFASGSPASTNNGDSCDIGVVPAATLLLPYFNVDPTVASGAGPTTLFTITNTSHYPQIAHVTVWTDWSFPVLDFNIFLTGYDVQGVNMYDIIARGFVISGSGAGTTIATVPGSPQPAGSTAGATPFSNTSNPNFVLAGSSDVRTTCSGLPGVLPTDLAAAVKSALTVGTGYSAGGVTCAGAVGGNHGATAAIGYVTVDVASYCSTQLPTDPNYYTGGVASLLFDNTLIGDYQQISPSPAGASGTGFDAGGNPMVHIRAVPEGGLSGATGGVFVATNLPFTFYDRYTLPVAGGAARTADRRQPLPSAWAARYIQGGTQSFATNFKIWREGLTGNAGCVVTNNSTLNVTSVVRFDEHENSYGFGSGIVCSPCNATGIPPLPETSATATTASNFPTLTGADVGGWMFLNLSNNAQYISGAGVATSVAAYTAQRPVGGFFGTSSVGGAITPLAGSRVTSQNWVIVSMFANSGAGRLAVDFDAAWLSNGCTPASLAGAVIAPGPQLGGPLVCPTGGVCGVGTLPPAVNP